MDVDTHLRWDLEELEWEDLPIGHNDKIITIIRSDIIQELLIPTYLHRLQYWSIMRECELLHGTRLHELISTPWLIRIGHDEGDVEYSIRIEISEYSSCKRWSTEKSDTDHRRGFYKIGKIVVSVILTKEGSALIQDH
jgi:hypothetical protein